MKKLFLALSIFTLISLNAAYSAKVSKVTVVKGKLSMGHEVSSFQPCGSKSTYWINDASSKLDALYEKVTQNSKKPYTEVYSEVKVVKMPKLKEGFAADYDGLYEVKEIIKAEPLSKKNQCK